MYANIHDKWWRYPWCLIHRDRRRRASLAMNPFCFPPQSLCGWCPDEALELRVGFWFYFLTSWRKRAQHGPTTDLRLGLNSWRAWEKFKKKKKAQTISESPESGAAAAPILCCCPFTEHNQTNRCIWDFLVYILIVIRCLMLALCEEL